MSQAPSIIIVVVFMVVLSLILSFIGNTFLEIFWMLAERLNRRRCGLNTSQNSQYNNSEENNELDTSEITL